MRNADFLKLWVGQSVSMAGSQVSVLAIPLIAAVLLDASPLEMGLLRAAGFLPVLVLGLPAGAWLDRVRRQPVMIAMDFAQALVLLLVPLLAVTGVLRMQYLYAVEITMGTCALVFDVAQSAWLPALLERTHLMNANSKLEMSRWTVQISGPGVAGALVQIVGAPLALVADASSFLVSAILLRTIRANEPPPSPGKGDSSTWQDMGAGLRFVLRHPTLRAFAVTAAASNVFAYAQSAVLVLYITRDLSLPATAFGMVLVGFGLGGWCGSFLGPRVADRVSYVGAITIGVSFMATGDLLVALSNTSTGVVIGQFLTGLGLPLCTMSMVTLRQLITPTEMLARVSATTRMLSWGALPAGALLGGALGDALGLQPTLMVAASGSAFVLVWVLAVVTPATRALPGSALGRSAV